jgi:glycine oxidase
MATPDLTVHGAGIFGLSVAWAAAQRGAKVRVIEAVRVGAGSSGGIVGALAPHTPDNWNPKKAFQLKSLLMAESWWAQVTAAGGLSPGYARTGRLQAVADDVALALAQQRTTSADKLWQGRAIWELARAGQSKWEPATPTGWLIHDTLSARIHPRRALEALVAALQAKGCEIILGEAAAYGPQIWATGAAGLQTLSEGHSRLVGTAVKGQAALLQFDAALLPQIFTEGLHVIAHADGTVAIGSTSERDWTIADSTDAKLEALIAHARLALPILADAPVLDRWAGLRPRSRNRSPMLGSWPNRPGHFIANGGFKIGFGMAPNIAETMIDLVFDGTDAVPKGFRVEDNF